MTIRTNSNQHHHTITNGTNTPQPPTAPSPLTTPAVIPASSRHPSLAGSEPGHGHGHAHTHAQGGQANNNNSNNNTNPRAPPLHTADGGGGGETPEQVLLASFKAAALSVTQLYKDSLKNQRAEHAKGYEAALQDLLAFITTHPVVQEKKDLGMTEDEIRQTTSLSIDDVVRFISSARAMNCNSAAVAAAGVAGNELHLHQQHHQHQQQLHAQQQQQQQQQAAHEQQQLHQQQLLHQQQQQQQEQQHQQEQQQQQQFLQQQQQQQTLEQQQHLQQQQQQQQLHHQQQQQQLQQQQQQQQSAGGGGGGGGARLSSSIASPSSIFPSEAFTFTAPIFHPGLGAGQAAGAFQSIFPGQEGGIGQQMAVDSLKRRYALQDFNMAASRMMSGANNNNTNINNNMVSSNGRMMANQPLNLNLNVNMDSFGAFHDQPPFKRNRRREGE
ncbi:hypothetical protein BGZ97_006936 [Linnemannia gamsii]|uniref:Uncharacterized protein n=1 Tax=Linnemannia gamsii TaxID=64522 RepID=A0A9P6URD0_9FUNG|nr:hypothetical protein BGZ97_006936 [Linnemannia gamsii]